jgi:hypothetical protein
MRKAIARTLQVVSTGSASERATEITMLMYFAGLSRRKKHETSVAKKQADPDAESVLKL